MAKRIVHRLLTFVASASTFMLVGAMLTLSMMSTSDWEYEWPDE